MKKIDLHIHTIATISDPPFKFSLDSLDEYVRKLEIDGIAITNHNLFDKVQYQEIASKLSIKVFPGIEIDVEKGHILLISESDDLDNFQLRCDKVKDLIKSKTDYISVEKLTEIFPDLEKYLLIPHTGKDPSISASTQTKLINHLCAGEVSGYTKFKSCIKDSKKLTPVIFSDARFVEQMETFPTRATYVDVGELSLVSLKIAFRDKTKVFISKRDGNEKFLATDDGLHLSTGLNVVLGERSSGKSHTLFRIKSGFSENIKYIEQFSLLQNDEDKFKSFLTIRNSNVTDWFLKEFKAVVDDVVEIDYDNLKHDVQKYVESLLKFASDTDKQDSFSKAKLFDETLYNITDLSNLRETIDATIKLIENKSYNEVITRHLDIKNLKALSCELIGIYNNQYELNLKRKWVNELVEDVRSNLRLNTSIKPPDDIDLFDIYWEIYKLKKFNLIANEIKKEREIDRRTFGTFKVVVTTKKFSGANRMYKLSKSQASFTDAFNNYLTPHKFLKSLKQINLPQTEYYKYFVDIDFKTLNKDNVPVSGGERSEFNLLHEIKDALSYDILLIDEPESSFDNLFLKSEVNKLLKAISQHIPVILVTHNSTVGASIKPDYILYTRKSIVNGSVKYQIFTGYPADKQLVCSDGDTVNNFDVLINCLEAGVDTYNDRNNTYEILKS